MDSAIRLPPNVTIRKVEREDSTSNHPSEVSDSSSSFCESEANCGSALEDASNLKDLGDPSLLSENPHILHKKLIPDINITYEELLSLKTKDLNRILKDVSKERCIKIKSIRRTLKNRGYAASSRVRSLAEKEEVEKEIGKIRESTKKVNEEINLCKYRLNVLKESCDQLIHSLDRYENADELKAEILAKVSQRMYLLIDDDPVKASEVEQLLKSMGASNSKRL